MSQNNIYIENDSISSYHNNLNSINNTYPNSMNISEVGYNNNYTQQNIPKHNSKKTSCKKKNVMNENMSFDNNYIKDRYTKIKEENANLKKKLFELEKDYKIQKGEMEEKVLVLRDENSNLQLQIQKAIEKQKNAYKNSDNISNENKTLLNNLNILKNDTNSLKDSITRKNAEIEEKNKMINDLLNEKNILVNDEKILKNQIQNLNTDKEILIQQIQDLNNTIAEKIAPKLRQNETNLINLQEQIESLRIGNEKLKNDNTLLFNENKIQKNLIKILTKQNKKLLGEIKIIYDRDILLMDNMEKMGSNNSENFKKFFDKNSLKNQNLFEEDMSILKQSQKYIGDEDENNNQKNDLNTLEINEEHNTEDIINKNYINIGQIKNKLKDNLKKQLSENSSVINNEIIIKRNKRSIDYEKEINNNINSNLNNINQKNLYNCNLTDDINNENISNNMVNERINEEVDINNKLKDNKINKVKNSSNPNSKRNEKYIKYEAFLTDKNNKNKIQDINDDINLNNKLIYSQDTNEIEHNRHLNNYFNYDYSNSNDINSDGFLYNTDGKINIKDDKNNNIILKNERNNNNELNLYYSNFNNTEENNNDVLFHSQAKSLLSEYVEDLDVIQYKEDNN